MSVYDAVAQIHAQEAQYQREYAGLHRQQLERMRAPATKPGMRHYGDWRERVEMGRLERAITNNFERVTPAPAPKQASRPSGAIQRVVSGTIQRSTPAARCRCGQPAPYTYRGMRYCERCAPWRSK